MCSGNRTSFFLARQCASLTTSPIFPPERDCFRTTKTSRGDDLLERSRYSSKSPNTYRDQPLPGAMGVLLLDNDPPLLLLLPRCAESVSREYETTINSCMFAGFETIVIDRLASSMWSADSGNGKIVEVSARLALIWIGFRPPTVFSSILYFYSSYYCGSTCRV